MNKKKCAKNAAWEKLQLTLLYFFIIVLLFFRTKAVVGHFPWIKINWLSFLIFEKRLSMLQRAPKPENLLVLYAALLRPITSAAGQTKHLSYLVKFNLTLILLFEMFQFLLLDFCDILFKKALLANNLHLKRTHAAVYSCVFSSFIMLYLYCYIIALIGKMPAFVGIINEIPHSAQYWIKSKTI